jgi:enamine deaminase RidA (YjgF/YER057c/UK114 family)
MKTERLGGRHRITSGAPWEAKVGYRRAVIAGDHVYVAGTVAVDADGAPFAPGDPGAQAVRCLEIIVAALVAAGARPEDVVRTRIFVTDMSAETQAAVGAAHHGVFADCPPASTMVGVSALAHPDFIVEIEADAIIQAA